MTCTGEQSLCCNNVAFGTLKDLPGVGNNDRDFVEKEIDVSVELITTSERTVDLMVKDEGGVVVACIPASSETVGIKPSLFVFSFTYYNILSF